ncbi:YtxH domain-containing protein [Vibrio sp. WXL210]|uniref:YtxH domain-containing protein n=1 Tax=Vibrio sp. WXL210 TaxID=3450709 RepID=UPI003EC7B17F
MSDSQPSMNPYEAYFRAMMDMQVEMAKAYANAQQNGYPMPPPAMHPGAFPPQMPPPMAGMMPPPPWGHGMPPAQPMQAPPHNHTQPAQEATDTNPLFEQAQAMLEGALGEEAGLFNEILGSFGMSDKEFWKGAMVGAAAALLLSNDNVRNKLMGMVSGAGDMLKTGGASVKDAAVNTASSVKENVSTGSEIFKDTVAAGKQGFEQSVEKHTAEPAVKAVSADTPVPADSDDDTKPVIKEQ